MDKISCSSLVRENDRGLVLVGEDIVLFTIGEKLVLIYMTKKIEKFSTGTYHGGDF